MAYTDLGITYLVDGQTDEYVTCNEALQRFARRESGEISVNLTTDANYTLVTTEGSEEYLDKYLTITDTGTVLTAGRDIVFPDYRFEWIVDNQTAQTLTLKLSGQTGVTLAAGSVAKYWNDGSDIALVASL